jgi:hypothetical protein
MLSVRSTRMWSPAGVGFPDARGDFPHKRILFPAPLKKFPVPRRREFASDRRAILGLFAASGRRSRSEIAKFPVFSLENREFAGRDGFARDCVLSQTNLLISLNFDILGCGPKKARFPGLCGSGNYSGHERAARRRLSAGQGRNISVGH